VRSALDKLGVSRRKPAGPSAQLSPAPLGRFPSSSLSSVQVDRDGQTSPLIWELPDWPHFRWDAGRLAQPLAAAHLKQGRLLGRLERLGFALQVEAELEATTEEAVNSKL
jgi:Domain of unknown function (DUF4172)